jgi:type I restriction enzyme, S subunit
MEVKPGYKQTEVGVIPEDWDVKPLGDIGESLIGLTYRPADVRSHGTLVLRASNIQDDGLRFDDNVFVQAEIPSRIMVRPDDILVCVRNGSRDLIGKSALIDERANGMTFGAFMAVFRSRSGRFINYLFQSEILKKQINAHLGATINQITNASLNSFRVPFPPTDSERLAITGALSDVNALLAGLDRLIAKKRDLKQAAMQQLLTGQARLPGFHSEWKEKRIDKIAPLQRGFDLPNPKLRAGSYPVVYSNGILNYHSDWQVEGPGVVTGRSGTIGKVTFVEGSYWPHNTALWVTSFKGNDPKFIFYLYTRIGFDRFATGSGVPTLNRNDVHTFEVLMPPTPAEQTAIAEVLSDMDAELAALEQRRDKVREIKQGMMQELLTGRTRLI